MLFNWIFLVSAFPTCYVIEDLILWKGDTFLLIGHYLPTKNPESDALRGGLLSSCLFV